MIVADGLKQHVKIGSMDEKITILRRGAETVNGLGEVTSIATTSFEVWANVKFRERAEDDLLNKQTNIELPEFTIRYMSLNEKDQITWESKTYDIVNIERLGRKMYLKITGKYVN